MWPLRSSCRECRKLYHQCKVKSLASHFSFVPQCRIFSTKSNEGLHYLTKITSAIYHHCRRMEKHACFRKLSIFGLKEEAEVQPGWGKSCDYFGSREALSRVETEKTLKAKTMFSFRTLQESAIASFGARYLPSSSQSINSTTLPGNRPFHRM